MEHTDLVIIDEDALYRRGGQVEETELLTVMEVAKHLRVDPTSVRRWIHEGILDAIRLPGGHDKYTKFRIKRETLERILEKTSLREVNHEH